MTQWAIEHHPQGMTFSNKTVATQAASCRLPINSTIAQVHDGIKAQVCRKISFMYLTNGGNNFNNCRSK